MAHTFIKPEKIIAQGLGLLQRELILPRLVQRYGKADFRGARNDTINIKIPSLLQGREYEFRTRNNPIEVDDLEEFTVDVRLDKHPYSAVKITDEELTLDITSWGEQVARPQIRAVAEKLEGYIATAMEDAPYRHEVEYAEVDPEDANPNRRPFYRALVQARKHLNQENVPAAGRVVLLGANVEAAALNEGHLVKVDESGSPSVLREATHGRLAGFTIIGNVNSVDPDFAVAMHPTAFAFGNVSPEVPSGVPAGSGLVYEGLAMRWIRDYEASFLRDRSVYSAFAGTASVDDGRDLRETVTDGGDTVPNPAFGELTDENVRAVKINFSAFDPDEEEA